MEAFAWFGERDERVAQRFMVALREALSFIERFPHSGAVIPAVRPESRARRLPVRSFPYHVVFVDLGDHAEVLAIAHNRREPGYWRSRE